MLKSKLSPTKGSISALNHVFWAFSAISILFLGFSLFAVTQLKLKPCLLCYLQQITYILILLGCVAGLKRKRMASWFLIIILSLGLLIAGYHVLSFYQIIQTKCSVPVDSIYSIRSSFSPLPCSSASTKWSLLGIPIQLVNFIIFLSMLFLLIKQKICISFNIKNS